MAMKTVRTQTGGGRPRRGHLGDESGMILVITMIIFLVLSTLAATDLINSFLERSLARNQNYASVAQTAADAGVAAGIAWLNDPAPPQGKTAADTASLNTAVPATWSKSFAATLTAGAGHGAGGAATYDASAPQSSNVTTTIRFKREGVDLNDDGDCTDAGESVRDLDGDGTDCGEVVFYTKCLPPAHGCFGYTQSAFLNLAASPYPVIVVDALGTYGTGSLREIEMEIARDKFSVKAYGAVTAASNVEATGNISIDGRAHDEDGILCSAGGSCSCTQGYPGVAVPCPPVDLDGDCVCDPGDTCYEATKLGAAGLAGDPSEWEINSTNPQPYTPDEALGLDPGDLASKLQGLPAAGATKTSGKITYINNDFDLSTGGSGVLIVHNPLFEARRWEASDAANGKKYNSALTCVERNNAGTNPNFASYDPCLDTGCSASCTPALLTAAGAATQADYIAARVPRNLEQHGANTFSGLIIADKVDKINGTADIIGALISLSTVSVDKLGNGAAHIYYSCDALAFNTDVGFSIKLNWHRVR